MKIKIPYKPRYPHIHELLESARFTVVVAHRRFGKTVLAINHLIKSAVMCQRQSGRFGYVAPFRTQAKAVAWDYLKFYAHDLPGFKINESELAISFNARRGDCKIRIFGADNPDALRGLYFDGIVLDEVAQMKSEVWGEIIQPALADRKGFAVFIGTPKGINLFSEIYFSAVKRQDEQNRDWAAIKIPVNESNALDQAEVDRLREELSDNAFRQELMCDFTASNDDALITLDEARASVNRYFDPELARQWPLTIGVDIARFGDDATVFYIRQGLSCAEPVILRKKSNTEVAYRLIDLIDTCKPRYVNIDQGQGTGVIDIVRDACSARNCLITEVPFGSRATEDTKYYNKRAEIWCAMRDWIRAGGSITNAPDSLIADLTSPSYSYDPAGRIKLESKDEIKKRLGRSTDLGDALALTFAVKQIPQILEDRRSIANKHKKIKNLINPFL